MTTLQSTIKETASAVSVRARLSVKVQNLAETIRFRRRMARNLAELRAFSPHLLDDIGLSQFHLMPGEAQEALYRHILRHR